MVGGELGGVAEERFWVEPGGLLPGVMTLVRATGEVERARGETGVCFLLGMAPPFLHGRLMRSFIDSALLGEVETLGEEEFEGVENDWEVLSMLLCLNRRKKDGFFFNLLEGFLSNFPILLPSQGILLRPSGLILVWSSGMV